MKRVTLALVTVGRPSHFLINGTRIKLVKSAKMSWGQAGHSFVVQILLVEIQVTHRVGAFLSLGLCVLFDNIAKS